MVRLIPNWRVKLVYHEFVRTSNRVDSATFHIEPRMTKLELREYLNKVYDMNVTGITTVNLPKKGDPSKVFKKAVVTFTGSSPPA